MKDTYTQPKEVFVTYLFPIHGGIKPNNKFYRKFSILLAIIVAFLSQCIPKDYGEPVSADTLCLDDSIITEPHLLVSSAADGGEVYILPQCSAIEISDTRRNTGWSATPVTKDVNEHVDHDGVLVVPIWGELCCGTSCMYTFYLHLKNIHTSALFKLLFGLKSGYQLDLSNG